MKHTTKAAALFCIAYAAGILCAVLLPSRWMVGLAALTVLVTGVLVIRD